MSIRVVLADDHMVFLQGLAALVAMEEGLEVIALCVNGEEALRVVGEQRPDVLVIDQSMPQVEGIDVVSRLRASGDTLPVIMLSASIDDDVLLAAVRLPAVSIVLKESAGRELIHAIHAAYRGERRMPPRLMERAFTLTSAGHDPENPWPELTERERDVVEAVAAGMSNKRIATSLDISEGTVKQYLHVIFRKLDVSNRVQLTLLATERSEE